MDRPAPARDRILDAARRLVLDQGFAATTVDAVVAAAGASKGAFFHHFASKAELGRALVAEYAAGDLAALEVAVAEAEAATDDPGEQVVAVLRRFEDGADDLVAAQPACLFVSFIYERGLADATTDRLVADAVLAWRRRLAAKLEAAGIAADLAGDVADHVFCTFEGAFLLARALDDPSRLRAQLAQARRYVELLVSSGS